MRWRGVNSSRQLLYDLYKHSNNHCNKYIYFSYVVNYLLLKFITYVILQIYTACICEGDILWMNIYWRCIVPKDLIYVGWLVCRLVCHNFLSEHLFYCQWQSTLMFCKHNGRTNYNLNLHSDCLVLWEGDLRELSDRRRHLQKWEINLLEENHLHNFLANLNYVLYANFYQRRSKRRWCWRGRGRRRRGRVWPPRLCSSWTEARRI